jgi:hypothetical protein
VSSLDVPRAASKLVEIGSDREPQMRRELIYEYTPRVTRIGKHGHVRLGGRPDVRFRDRWGIWAATAYRPATRG